MKLSESMRLAAKLIAAYPSARLGTPEQAKETLQVYAECLEDLDHDQAKRAVLALVAESKFFPTIAEIRQRVASAEVPSAGAEDAWGAVKKAIGKFGQYQTPEFDDPAIAMAVAAVGWRTICVSENEGIERAAFRSAYNSAVERLRRMCNADRLLAAAEARGQLAPRADRGGESIGAHAAALKLLKGGES